MHFSGLIFIADALFHDYHDKTCQSSSWMTGCHKLKKKFAKIESFSTKMKIIFQNEQNKFAKWNCANYKLLKMVVKLPVVNLNAKIRPSEAAQNNINRIEVMLCSFSLVLFASWQFVLRMPKEKRKRDIMRTRNENKRNNWCLKQNIFPNLLVVIVNGRVVIVGVCVKFLSIENNLPSVY